jgi:hypothetical protein
MPPTSKKKEAVRLAKKYPDLYAKPTCLSRFHEWEKQKLHKFLGPKGEKVYAVVSYNMHYGDLITSFQVDGNQLTSVEDKYLPGRMIRCHVSAGLCGVRPFERNDLTFEFLYKPLGLLVDPETVPSTGAGTDPVTHTGGWDKLYSSFWFFRETLEKAGGKYIDRFK